MIKECKPCKKHLFQDAQYGQNMRVFNVSHKTGELSAVCTVCGTKVEIRKKEVKNESKETEKST